MAVVLIPDEKRTIEDKAEINAFLKPFGIYHERWPLEERVDPDAAQDEILKAYEKEIDVLKKQGGYVTADVISVNPQTPNLDAMLAKFTMEHTHSEDEVRFILKGRGLFHIHPDKGPIFAIQVEAGDLINVPKGTKHWFHLCEDKTIRAIRLFQDTSGWTPAYIENGRHTQYAPVCWGPNYVKGEKPFVSSIKV
jgi:1,2-dihydroxy-3-keto-5-methylthiopentene dioxygenase